MSLIVLISASAFASWDEETGAENEKQMGSFHNTNSRKTGKKELCDTWMNMQNADTSAKKMDFSRPKLNQMGDYEDPDTSSQMQ